MHEEERPAERLAKDPNHWHRSDLAGTRVPGVRLRSALRGRRHPDHEVIATDAQIGHRKPRRAADLP